MLSYRRFATFAFHVQVLSINSGNASMAATVKRLEPIVAERREKMKEEMMGEPLRAAKHVSVKRQLS